MLTAIPLLGTWSGWVTVRCDVRVVHEIAARMRDPDLERPADMDEAGRWLVTAIAQAVQPVLDPFATMGETVVLDRSTPWSPPSSRLAASMRLWSADRFIGITLHERVAVTVRKSGAFPSDLEGTEAPALAVGGEGVEDP